MLLYKVTTQLKVQHSVPIRSFKRLVKFYSKFISFLEPRLFRRFKILIWPNTGFQNQHYDIINWVKIRYVCWSFLIYLLLGIREPVKDHGLFGEIPNWFDVSYSFIYFFLYTFPFVLYFLGIPFSLSYLVYICVKIIDN